MSLFGNKPKSAQQKAQWAKTRIMIRAIVILYFIFYILIPLINTAPEDAEVMNPILRWSIVAVFSIAAVALGAQTAMEYFRNQKAGNYKAEAYTDDSELNEIIDDSETTDSDISKNNEDEYEGEDEYDEK